MKYAFYNGYILDGKENMQPVGGMAILTDGEKIVDIVADTADLSGYEKVDLGGKYIMPGLINMHVHLPASGKPAKKRQDPVKLVKLITSGSLMRTIGLKLCSSFAKMQLFSGVTTIRTMGGVADFDTVIRDRINAKTLTGPRILAANMAVSVPGGHMAGSLAYRATSPRQAAEYVEKIAREKPDVIKLMITGGVLDAKKKGEPGEMKMGREMVKAACDAAHGHGLKVAAHVESPEGVRVALECGVDTIEHGAQPDRQIIQLFKEKGACHIATLSPALPYALFDREISGTSEIEQYNGKIVFDGVISCAKACLENGIPVGLGTDTGCPYITHYDMWRELNYFKKYCGVSNAFAMHTATMINAKLAGIDDITGSLEKGKMAEMIVTAQNPLEDLQALRKIDMVVFGGQIIVSPTVKKYEQVEKELDKFV